MITLQNVGVSFGKGANRVDAVRNVTLTINRGDVFGVIGYSGAGKSTLVRTINLLQRPTEGKVAVNGVDLMQLNASELRTSRKKIGMIFQHFNLMNNLSVFQNVAFPLKKSGLSKEAIAKKVGELLELVGIAEKADNYPRALSGGQKQRVAIARALANDPEVLLCDEATSALDPKTTYAILDLLKQVNEQLGITIVIIAHEMQVVKAICNRVAVMEDGAVIESGSILDIFTAPKNELTKDFIDTATHVNQGIDTVLRNPNLLHLSEHDVVMKISFVGSSTGKPLIAHLATAYQVEASILFGGVEIIQNTPIGTLLIALRGEPAQIAIAQQYLSQADVTTEQIDVRQFSAVTRGDATNASELAAQQEVTP